MRQMHHVAPLAVFSAFTMTACTTLPDVKPFAETTAALSAAAGTHYRDVASEIASLTPTTQAAETDESESFKRRKIELENSQKVFAATEQNLNALFAAMTTYSERVVSLTEAGKSGPDAAQSLLDSANGFAMLGGLPAITIAEPITKAFKAIADEFSKRQTAKSLKEAVAAAEPGINLIAEQFEVIYGQATNIAASSLAEMRKLQASQAAGPSVIGFHDIVKENYNAYYQFLIGFVNEGDPTAAESVWRGFCRKPEGGKPEEACLAKDELEAVGLVEARMEAIQPIVETYTAQMTSIDTTEVRRLAASKAVIKAVKAWATEHQKLRSALEDGTSLSAFNLKAALLELSSILGKEPGVTQLATVEP